MGLPKSYIESPLRAIWDNIRKELLQFENYNHTRVYPTLAYMEGHPQYEEISAKLRENTLKFLAQMIAYVKPLTTSAERDDFSHKIAIVLLRGTIDDLFCRLYEPHRFYTYLLLSYARCVGPDDELMMELSDNMRKKIAQWIMLSDSDDMLPSPIFR